MPEETKAAARQLGGRRGLMASAEAALLLDGSVLTTPEGRQDVRARLMAARASGKLGAAMFRDLLAGLDSAVKDQPKAGVVQAPALVVEVQKFGSNGAGATS